MSTPKTPSKVLFNLVHAVVIAAVATSPDSRASRAGDSEWELALGVGAVAVSTPWKEANDQVAVVPFSSVDSSAISQRIMSI